MAGGAITPTAKSGRKSLDATINLVPFIDLLSCCISFLLITAVWTQLSSLPISHGDKGGSETPVDFYLTVHVREDGLRLERSNGEAVEIAQSGERGDFVKLASLLQELKQLNPDKEDVTVHAADRVAYQRVIQTMDILRAAKFTGIRFAER